jgi:hypothetical protein
MLPLPVIKFGGLPAHVLGRVAVDDFHENHRGS